MARNQFITQYGELSGEIMLNIAEMLALRLPEGRERILAAKWTKKFNICDPNEYKNYLTLFVSCLTKQVLVEPFTDPPADLTNTWQPFSKEYTQTDINNAVIQRLYMDSFTPPYKMDLSNDLKEYVAFQEIPFFGAHFYYAFSPSENIDRWNKFNKMNVPKRLVDELRKDEPVESPIKGRLRKRPAPGSLMPKAGSRPRNLLLRKTGIMKPTWQDVLEKQEAEKMLEPKKPMILIPTDVPAKNIPPALQRRMEKAERDRLEKQSRKELEAKDRISRLAQPKQLYKPEPRPSQLALAKATRKPSMTRKSPTKPKSPVKPKSPAPKPMSAPASPASLKEIPNQGPNADLKSRLARLRSANTTQTEVLKATQEINKMAADLNRENERLAREGTANLKEADKIQGTGFSVGTRILNMIKESQAEEMQRLAEEASEAIDNISLTMIDLEEILEGQKLPQKHDDAVKRLNDFKERIQKTSADAQNVSIKMNTIKTGQELLEVMDNIINVSANSARKLHDIEIESPEEEILIDGLESSNNELHDLVKAQRERLEHALENNEPAILVVLEEAVKTVDDLLSSSINEDIPVDKVDASSNLIKAVEIELSRNDQLIDINDEAAKIMEEVDNTVAKVMNANISGDLIDIDKQDLGFADVMDDNEVERLRQLKMMERQERLEEIREKMQLIQLCDKENLMDVSCELVNALEASVTEIDQVLIPGLQKIEINSITQNDSDAVRQAIEGVELQTEVLNDSLIKMIALKDAIVPENDEPIDYDLIDLEDDLINFD